MNQSAAKMIVGMLAVAVLICYLTGGHLLPLFIPPDRLRAVVGGEGTRWLSQQALISQTMTRGGRAGCRSTAGPVARGDMMATAGHRWVCSQNHGH